MVKVFYKIISTWDTEITNAEGENISVKGISFSYDDNSLVYTVYLPIKNLNINKIKNAIKDYYKNNIKMDVYKGVSDSFDDEEVSE